jgi:hypothetical protein
VMLTLVKSICFVEAFHVNMNLFHHGIPKFSIFLKSF